MRKQPHGTHTAQSPLTSLVPRAGDGCVEAVDYVILQREDHEEVLEEGILLCGTRHVLVQVRGWDFEYEVCKGF